MRSIASAFWRAHAGLPLAAFAAAFFVLEVLEFDPVLARAWYFDVATMHWLGTGSGDWWAHSLLHTGGRWMVRAVAAGAVAIWALSFVLTSLREHRRPAGFVAIAIVLSASIVGGLKAATNVDCPWDLAGFGGLNPYVPLFADRPDALPRAACFPGAHSSSGFALVCFYFLWRDRSPRRARWALAAGLAIGCAFSIGQEARGAHFLSHDLTSAAIVWCIQLALYARWFNASSRSSPTCRTSETR
ncbi:MAG: phosphatase PAP2 family protein [Steroidobacteraceae bacterium]|nr:phosphatase PAP2 family protein [Steroidobacteraceae bacterium]